MTARPFDDAERRVVSLWAERLGVPPGDLTRPGIRLTTNPESSAAYALWRGNTMVIAISSDRLAEARERVRGATARDLMPPPALLAAIGMPEARVVGPAYQGFLRSDPGPAPTIERVEFTPIPSRDGLAPLRAAVAPEEWRHASLDPARGVVVGAIRDGELVAAAAAGSEWPGFAAVGILTRRDARGGGLATAAAHHAVVAALRAELLPIYQTLQSNEPSLAVARKLGFEHFGSTLSLRL